MSRTAHPMSGLPPSLRALRDSLEAEREALIANDTQALLRTTEEKSRALRALGGAERAAQLQGLEPELRTLSDLNRANGALIARRRQEAIWTLQQLGLYERSSAYDQFGGIGSNMKMRVRGSA